MIVQAAKRHGVPEKLVRRVVMRESRYNPGARNHRYWGLMQISYPTAKSMGFRGSPEELLNPVINLRYAVPYLANAFIAAGKREDAAVRLYASGYYDTARHRGLLSALRTADSAPLAGSPEPSEAVEASAPMSFGIFGALIGPSTSPASSQQVATLASEPAIQTASPAPVEPSYRSVPLPQGKRTIGGVDLAADGSGRSRPPAKWLHDGGLTILAKGEQSGDTFEASKVAQGTGADPGAAGGRMRKSATFASLDAPGQRLGSAQAYAASATDEVPAPQAAIAQALSTATPGGQASLYPVAPQPARQAAAAAGAEKVGDGDKEAATKSRRRRAARRREQREAKRAKAIEANAAPEVAEAKP